LGSDPIIVAWHQDGFSGACVASGGPEEGGGGEEPVTLYAALGMRYPIRV